MSEFLDFAMGDGDETVGKKGRRFDPKPGTTYRLSFLWFRDKKEDGAPDFDGKIRFIACDRIYVEGVGFVNYKSPAYAQFSKDPSRQAVATIVGVWPVDAKGIIDKTRLREVTVMPWVFASDKYKDLGEKGARFPLNEFDMSIAVGADKYKKITFTPERDSCFRTLAASDKDGARELVRRILEDVSAVETTIRQEMGQDLTVDQIREKLGTAAPTPSSSGSRAAPDADSLLDGI